MQVKHAFTSGKGDGPDSTLVRPSNWNADHQINMTAASKYVGRDKSGSGTAQELPVVPVSGTDDGTMWTAAKIQEYVAQQIGSIPGGALPVPMGTIVGSVNGIMPGYLPLNGGTFGDVGSGATYQSALYQNLYIHMWTVAPSVPVTGGRGASGSADWAAKKSMTLPQSAGAVLSAQGLGGMATAFEYFQVVGSDTAALDVTNLPAHSHGFSDNAGGNLAIVRGSNSGLGGAGGGSALWVLGNDAIVTTTVGGGIAHANVQRTMIMQVWWIKY